jgi:hypothetical protein
MELAWKEDWEEARQRLLAWWELEAIDRPCLQIFAVRDGKDLPVLAKMVNWWPGPGDEKDFETGEELDIETRWLRADHIVRTKAQYMDKIYWAGEAFPFYFTNQGPVSIPAYLGAKWEFDERTGWGRAVIDDWEDFNYIEDMDENNPYWKATMDITRLAVEAFKGKGLVSMSDLGSGGDELVTLRGNDRMLTDLIDCPKIVKEKLEWVKGFLEKYYDVLFDIIYPELDSTVTWLGSYYEGRTVTLQCDFSCMISEKMFQEFFLPIVQYQASKFDRVCYHLDGPGAIRHLDALLAVPEIHAIQWVPGAGAPPMAEWIDLLKRIQDGGKAVHASCKPEEVEPITRALKPEGLCIGTYALNKEHADQLLKKAGDWAV